MYNYSNFLKGYDYYFDNSYYGGNVPILLNTGSNTQQTDYRRSPKQLVKYWTSSKIALGIYDKINSEVTKEDFCFRPIKPTASQNIADQLTNLLNENVDIQLILDKIIAGFWGTGGDILVYYKNGKFNAYNFFEEGCERIGFYLNRNNQIYKYDILDLTSGQRIDTIEARNAVHLKFANPFSSVLGVTPAIVLYDIWELKESISTSNKSIFKNGLQASKLISLKPFRESAGEGELSHTIEYLDKLTQEIKQGSGLYNRNKTWVSGVPGLQVDDLQLDNVQMETMNFIDKIDEQTYLAFGLPMEVFNPRYNKYNDVEILRDMIRKYIDKKMRVFTYGVVTEFILPRLIPNFRFNKYEYKYKKTITAEDIELQNQRIEKTKVFFDFLTEAKKSGLNVSLTDEKKTELEEYGVIIETGTPLEPTAKEPKSIEQEAKSIEQEVIEDIEQEEEDVQEETRAINQDELNEVFTKYKESVNMSASELESWSNTECSKKASLDRSPITRNLRLLKTKKSDWTNKDITDANKTISFIARMKANLGGENIVKTDDGKECGTKAYISLKNWAYDNNKNKRNLIKARQIFRNALQKQLADV